MTGASLASRLQRAQQLFEQRQWPELDQCCRQILAEFPNQPDTLAFWGAMALQAGNAQAAVDVLAGAIRVSAKPTGFMWLQLGSAMRALGRVAEAEAALQQAYTAMPGQAAPSVQLGVLYHTQGQAEKAITFYRQAVALQPGAIEAWNNLGMLLQERRQYAEAESCFRKVLAVIPRLEQTEANLGAVLQLQGKFPESLAVLERAYAQFPQSALVCNNLGFTHLAMKNAHGAEAAFRQAIALNGRVALYFRNLGAALLLQGRLEASIKAQRQALELEPQNATAFSNLLLTLHYLPGMTSAQLLAEHQQFAARLEPPLKASWIPPENGRDPDRHLRIGYVSGDFCDHAVAFFIEPVLIAHDRTQVEIFCYYNQTRVDAVTQRLRRRVENWRDVAGLSDEQLAAQIRADAIDILVDLSGHTAENRLLTFMRRPAPVQMTWLGYPGTTGLAASMDYRLTDASWDPPGEAVFSERTLYLPRWAAWQPPMDAPAVSFPVAREAGNVTFACLNNPVKINAEVLAAWASLMQALPAARLLLGNISEGAEADLMRERLEAAGIASARVELRPRVPLATFLAWHADIDVALDPFPFPGGLTTYHALWMGVPVVTLRGATSVARQGAAILGATGLDDACIAHTADEYVSKAVALALDADRRAALRGSLRDRMAVWTDGPAQARALEGAYREAWRHWCAS